MGYADIPKLISKVVAGITIAKKWKPGTINYQSKYTTESPLENDLHKQEMNDFEMMPCFYYKTNGVITINLMTINWTTFKI